MPSSVSSPSRPILVTGSAGLVGTKLLRMLEAQGEPVRGFDLRAGGRSRGDIRDRSCLRQRLRGCGGVIHLAAVSRVIWGERDPARCRSTNVDGLRNLIEIALEEDPPPWLIFASSREVYGQPKILPVTEDAPLCPVNVYGRTKLAGEAMVDAARRAGLRTAIVRLSNVYGSTTDHADRVVPAFARAALAAQPLRVEGPDSTFDFTHVDDVVRGMLLVMEQVRQGGLLPPIHLVTGVPTTLAELAAMTVEIGASSSRIDLCAPRDFDVARFHGDPARARTLLGWEARIPLRHGIARLIEDLRRVA